MDRLKCENLAILKISYRNLHSNMDRLKLSFSRRLPLYLMYLHSNMDRLKSSNLRVDALVINRSTFQYG